MSPQTVITMIYIAAVLLLLFVCVREDARKRYYVPVKLLASALFLIYAVMARGWHIILFPLFSCFIGDAFMGIYNIKRRKRFLIAGILFFMTAHIGFLVWLFSLAPELSVLDIILPIAGGALAALIMYLCHMHLGRLRPAAIVYACFVTAFMQKAVRSGMGAGGVLFFVSDLLILFLYFYHFRSRKLHRLVHVANLATYYLAIMLLAVG